ncbi:MAG: PorP/SprF family type IX secretion system membrane protein [Chitinophagales bacterium]
MKTNKYISLLFILFSCYFAGKSQDVHFTQHTLQPLQKSPAFAGDFDGNYRFAALYRNQWATIQVPYNTLGASFDLKVLQSQNKQHVLGSGLYLNFDQTGDGKYQTLYTQIPIAYHFSIPIQSFRLQLSPAFYIGYIRKSLDLTNLHFDSQFTSDGFNPNAPINENFTNLNFSNLDIGTGFHLEFKNENGLKFGIGMGIHHLNTIEETLLDDSQSIQLEKRVTNSAQMLIPIKDKWEIQLDYLFQEQQQKSEHIFGTIATYYFVKNEPVQKGISLGSYYRWQDAASFIIQYKHNQITAGFSYDINTSDLKKATNTYGATEIGIVYTIKKVEKFDEKRKLKCFVF